MNNSNNPKNSRLSDVEKFTTAASIGYTPFKTSSEISLANNSMRIQQNEVRFNRMESL